MGFFRKSVSSRDMRSSIVNSAKTLLANVRFLSVDEPVHTIVITSAVPNEGKTFVTANFASAIATSGHSALLVECDMRRRSMARSLGVHARKGIYEVLSAPEITSEEIEEAAIATQIPNLYFLDAEPHLPSPSDILNSERFARFVEVASSTYDYVVFDTPPVGAFVDAAVLGTKVDAVLLVVREHSTKRAEMVAAAEQLRKAGCNLAGAVMNYCDWGGSDHYYEYYREESSHNGEASPQSTGFIPPVADKMGGAGGTSTSKWLERPGADSERPKSTALPKRPKRRSRRTAESDEVQGNTEDVATVDAETHSGGYRSQGWPDEPVKVVSADAVSPAPTSARTSAVDYEYVSIPEVKPSVMDTSAYVALVDTSHQTLPEQDQQSAMEPVRQQAVPTRGRVRRAVPYIPTIDDDF